MGKKTLEEKIKDIVFYATVFFILYLIIGFLIKSEWLSNFEGSWTYPYELLRDAFTLTAYFLAPVAAFILFSDWREQHAELAIEVDSTHIYKGISELINQLYNIHYDIEDTDNYEGEAATKISNLMLEVSNNIQSLKIVNSQIESRGKDGKMFAECAKKLFEEITCINLELSQLCVCKTKLQNPEKYNGYIKTTSAEYSQHIQAEYEGLNYQITRSYPKLNILKVELSALCDGLRIKN